MQRLFNILLDFYCTMGNTSKLSKFLRDRGLTVRHTDFDFVRLRFTRHVDHNLLNVIEGIFKAVEEARGIWSSMCIEVWIEEDKGEKISSPLLRKQGEVCTYIRPGARARLIRKIVWLDLCKPHVVVPIPESAMRKCVSAVDHDELARIATTIKNFIEVQRELKEHKVSS
jgi:hypothetical protein